MDRSATEKGLVHVYTGEGKGKTTAALGVALRAIGWGMRVCVIQFIKGYSDIGEALFAKRYPEQLTLRQFAIDPARNIDKCKVAQRKHQCEEAMKFAECTVMSEEYDLVILDEINNAIHYGLIDALRILNLIENKPGRLELILTGRGAPQEIVAAADYVTEMKQIKHPYEQGIPARKGIDY